METYNVKKYIGKRIVIILRNNFRYTCVLPEFNGTTFAITDKFGKDVEIDCDYIATIIEHGDAE